MQIDQTEVKQLVAQLSECKGRVIQINVLMEEMTKGTFTLPDEALEFMARQAEELADQSNQIMGYLKLLFQGAE